MAVQSFFKSPVRCLCRKPRGRRRRSQTHCSQSSALKHVFICVVCWSTLLQCTDALADDLNLPLKKSLLLRDKSALVLAKQRAPEPLRPSPQFTHPVEILVQARSLVSWREHGGAGVLLALQLTGNRHNQLVHLPDLWEQGTCGRKLPQAGGGMWEGPRQPSLGPLVLGMVCWHGLCA